MSSAVGYASFASLADPPGASVLLPAVSWLQGTLLGTVATVAAILGVAAIGAAMLTGRVAVRPALVAVLGCFILFGASGIAAGIRASAGAGSEYPPALYVEPALPPLPEPAPPPAPSAPPASADPHAGASVPGE